MPYRTFTRNQLLASFLSRLRSKRTGQVFLESCGEGVLQILQDGEAYSGRRPEYDLFGDELRLPLWAKRVPLLGWPCATPTTRPSPLGLSHRYVIRLGRGSAPQSTASALRQA